MFFLGVLLVSGGCYYDNEEALYPGTVCDTTSPSYTTTISTIISSNCQSCHAGSTPSAGLSLTSYSQVKSAVETRNLLNHLLQKNGYSLMPPSGQLSNCNIDQINSWIANGMPEN
jgi:cytochrome c5